MKGQSLDIEVFVKKYVIAIGVLTCLSFAAAPDASMGKAKMAQMFQVPFKDVKTHFETIQKSRTLNENEKVVQKLSVIAEMLKVESISTYSNDLSGLYPQLMNQAIINKIHQNPKWDKPLGSGEIKKFEPEFDFIKKSFGEKSYVWAWFLKQQGKTAEAKTILIQLFDERSAHVLSMTELHFGGNGPLNEVQYIQEALEPMVMTSEKELLNAKFQKLKNHLSNLPNSMIQT
jgi:hypothetical protein